MKKRLMLLIGLLGLSAFSLNAADSVSVNAGGESTWKKLELFAGNHKIVTSFGFEGTQTITFATDSSLGHLKKELMTSLAKGFEEVKLETGGVILSDEKTSAKYPETEGCLFVGNERTLYLSLAKVPVLERKHLVQITIVEPAPKVTTERKGHPYEQPVLQHLTR